MMQQPKITRPDDIVGMLLAGGPVKSKYEVGEQPCNDFKPEAGVSHFMHNEHECPICWHTRSFCLNCHRDHHEGGWETCTKEARKTADGYEQCEEEEQ